jgi:hypothetical protein
MSKKYHGAKEGYTPPQQIDWEIDPHKLTEDERKARREKNQASKRSRDQHRKRNKHGH